MGEGEVGLSPGDPFPEGEALYLFMKRRDVEESRRRGRGGVEGPAG